jgi:hypothetical protein
MRRRLATLVAVGVLCAGLPARAATLLPTVTITTAVTATSGQVLGYVDLGPRNLAVEAVFTYGSGGTTTDAYLQTSFDGGTTWFDIANFHFTTSSSSKLINLSSLTPVTSQVTPTSGSMTANTAQDGLVGSQLRVLYQSSGTYAGGTTLQVNVITSRLNP